MTTSALGQPNYDSVLAIDERLRQLEMEAQDMEKKYQFVK